MIAHDHAGGAGAVTGEGTFERIGSIRIIIFVIIAFRGEDAAFPGASIPDLVMPGVTGMR